MDLIAANHYVLDGAVAGTVDTSSLTGDPVVSLQFNGADLQDPQLRESFAGLEVSALIGARPDLDSQELLVLLPRVNILDEPVVFAGLGVVVTTRTTIGGPKLINGAVHSYEIHPVAGNASVVEF
jgi:hypothetical protein